MANKEMQAGFEAQRKAGINVDWFTWQIAWHDATLAPVDGGISNERDSFDEIRAALHETYGFSSTSPRAQENINFVLGKLDEIEVARQSAPSIQNLNDAAKPCAHHNDPKGCYRVRCQLEDGQKLIALAKAAWDEAWKIAYSEGMSAGHPLGKSSADSVIEWRDSDAYIAALSMAKKND